MSEIEGEFIDGVLTRLKSQLASLQIRVKELEDENAKLSSQLSTSHRGKSEEKHGGPNPRRKKETERIPGFDSRVLSQHSKRYVALKVMYFGSRFYGFSSEGQMEPTVESEIFKAFEKTRLIVGDKKESQYSRCGRTDKGVSSVGQVIALFLRSNFKEVDAYSNTQELVVELQIEGEIDYVRVLNRVLPNDIRILGWSPVSTDFSARFSCLARVYKYYFWRGSMDLLAMERAGKKFIGEHDFRNFCKMDAANVHNYRRCITSFEIGSCDMRFCLKCFVPHPKHGRHIPDCRRFDDKIYNVLAKPASGCIVYSRYYTLVLKYSDNQLCVIKIKGSAFLWHQVRCMVAVLFMIGQGLESSDVVDALLDTQRTPRKPQYSIAPDMPLVLQDCEFENVKFICSPDAGKALFLHLESQCLAYQLQSAIYHEAVLNCVPLATSQSIIHTAGKKAASHVPLLSRPTEPSYEERSTKLNSRQNVRHVLI